MLRPQGRASIAEMLLAIGGHPRSGTTMVRNMLNTVDNLYVTRELPLAVYPKVMDLLDAWTKHCSKGGPNRERSDPERLIAELWFGLSKFAEDAARFEEAGIIGNKTPGSEVYFARYQRILGRGRIKFIYCWREPIKTLRSVINMPWSMGDFEAGLRKLRDRYMSFERDLSEIRSDTHIFQVDKFAAAPSAAATELCRFLGLADEAAEPMTRLPPANTLEEKIARESVVGPVELTDEQVAKLRADPVVTGFIDRVVRPWADGGREPPPLAP